MPDRTNKKDKLLDLADHDCSRGEEFGLRKRSSFRMPFAEDHEIRAVVDGETFPILDMGSRGIGILLADRDRFVRGESLSHLVIIIGTEKLAMKGRVVHVTCEDDLVVCGIALKGMDEGVESCLQAFLLQHRNVYFAGRR